MSKAAGEAREYLHDTGERQAYQLVRSARKSIGLYVFRDGRVVLRAPNRTSMATLHDFLRTRWDWLQDRLREFAAAPPAPRVPIGDGVRMLHLGEWLTVRLAVAGRSQVVREAETLWVKLPEARQTEAEIAAAIDRFQKKEALHIFAERLQAAHARMHPLRLPLPPLKIRRMRSRWGSCSSRGDITLNLELIRMPLRCIDYVVVHELCHLREFHHGAAFYALQERFEPHWRERKAELKQLAGQTWSL